jgi:hypothetical protein
MKYRAKSFQVPATNPTKTPCAIHHIVKGKCLRCDHKVTGFAEITPAGRHALRETVPTDSEGAE